MSSGTIDRYVDTGVRWKQALSIAVLVVLIALPQFLGVFRIRLAIDILILLLFVVSYDFILGYAGVLSFGHALPYGVGAYFLALGLEGGALPFLPQEPLTFTTAVLFALIVVVLVMLVTGALALQTSGVYFAMVTLALAQIAFIAMVELDDVTGGENGLFLTLPDPFGYSLGEITNVYYLSAIVVVVSYLIMRHLVKTPFGLALRSIRQNEERARFIGLNAFRFKLAAYTISGVFAGIAGMLFAIANAFITPDLLQWETTGDAVIMAIIGGLGSLWGPALGVVVTFSLEEVVSGMFIEAWPIFVGIFFILVVLFMPGGIAGVVNRRVAPRLRTIREGEQE
jgi:branched-chain amino acid transport system permease protein